MRFNPLYLAKIACFAKWINWAKCVSSDFLNEKVSMILTCIILKIKARLNFDKICIFHKHLRSPCGAERKLVKKKFAEANFSNLVSYLLYAY